MEQDSAAQTDRSTLGSKTVGGKTVGRLASLATFPLRFVVFAGTWALNASQGRRVALALAHSRVGRIWERRGRLNKAIARYRRALQINPDCLESRRNLGMILIAKKKFLDAMIHLEEVLALAPDDREALGVIERLSRRTAPAPNG